MNCHNLYAWTTFILSNFHLLCFVNLLIIGKPLNNEYFMMVSHLSIRTCMTYLKDLTLLTARHIISKFFIEDKAQIGSSTTPVAPGCVLKIS